MPRRNRPQRQRKSRRVQSTQPILKSIRDELVQQSIHPSPLVPDVQIMKLARVRTCSFIGNYDVDTISTSTTALVPKAYAVALSNVNGYTDMTSCFDQYRIMQVIFSFEVAGAPASVQASASTIYTALDYDDQTTPVSSGQLQQYDTCMTVPVGTYFRRVFNPRVAFAAYGSGVFTSFANQRAGWVDSGSPGVAHFGLKVVMSQASSAVTAYNIKAQVFLQFRSQI